MKLNLSRKLPPKIISYWHISLNMYANCESIVMLMLNSGKAIPVNKVAVVDVIFLPSVLKIIGVVFGALWYFWGKVDQWIIVFVNPESIKTFRIFCGWPDTNGFVFGISFIMEGIFKIHFLWVWIAIQWVCCACNLIQSTIPLLICCSNYILVRFLSDADLLQLVRKGCYTIRYITAFILLVFSNWLNV